MIRMGTNSAKEHLAIYFLVGILCLPLASCITTTLETQPFVGSTASITEEDICDTNLEKGPANKTQHEGERVALTCDVNDNNTHNILWRRSTGLGKWRTISNKTNILYKPSARYNIKFNYDEQMYKFVIRNAKFQRDSGIYECGYECTPGGNFISLASAEVTVIRRPTCVIQTLPSSRSDRGNRFEVVCSWAPGQEGDARFESSGGPIGSTTLSFKNNIISRFESNDTTDVTCRFSSSSDPPVTITEPCAMKDRKVRVDPFINEVAAGSNASFVCSSDYSTHFWNTRLTRDLYSGSIGHIVKHGNNLTIIDVSESDQNILVECSVQDHETGNISSFGIIRIVEVTTPTCTLETPGDYITQLTYRGTSERAQDSPIRSSRPIRRSTAAPFATYPSVSKQRPIGPLLTCKLHRLPATELALNREYELNCSWNGSLVNYAYFQRINEEKIINADMEFPDHIIARVNSSGTNVSCRLSVNTNTSRQNMTTPCIDGHPRLIRVDPFMSEVAVGATAVINCTFNEGGRQELLWKVKSDGNAFAVNSEKHKLYPDATFYVHERVRENYMIFECRFLTSNIFGRYKNHSSYGALHVVEGSTTEFQSQPTVPGDRYTSKSKVTLDVRTRETSDFTTLKNKVPETTFGYNTLTTSKSSTQYEDDQTSNQSIDDEGEEDNSTANQITIAEGQTLNDVTLSNSHTNTMNTGPTRERQISTDALAITKTTDMIGTTQSGTVKVLISVLAVLAVIVVLIAIVYLRNRLLPPRRQDEKPDGIELSNIPHILHEESSQWYALSFKDKRVQQSPSDDLKTLHHHDHSGDTLNSALSTSIGMLTLQPSEFTNDHLYAEPGATGTSEEPLRDIISRQQCTFTPLTDND